jgi:hypothetical protein
MVGQAVPDILLHLHQVQQLFMVAEAVEVLYPVVMVVLLLVGAVPVALDQALLALTEQTIQVAAAAVAHMALVTMVPVARVLLL